MLNNISHDDILIFLSVYKNGGDLVGFLNKFLWRQVLLMIFSAAKILVGAFAISLILVGTLSGIIVLSYFQIVAILVVMRIIYGVIK